MGSYQGAQEINDSLRPREVNADFKRKFGKEKDLRQFCKENDINVPEKPFIKNEAHFGKSLAQERLFIESTLTRGANFDILSHKENFSA